MIIDADGGYSLGDEFVSLRWLRLFDCMVYV